MRLLLLEGTVLLEKIVGRAVRRTVPLDLVTDTDTTIEVALKRGGTGGNALTLVRDIGNLVNNPDLPREIGLIGEIQKTDLIGEIQKTDLIGEIQGIGIIGGGTQGTDHPGEIQRTYLIGEIQGIGIIGGGTQGTDHPGEILDLVLVTDTGDLVDTLTQGIGHQEVVLGIGHLENTQGLGLVRDTGIIVLILVLTPVREIVIRSVRDTPLPLRREMETTLTLMRQTRMNLSNQCELFYNSNIYSL